MTFSSKFVATVLSWLLMLNLIITVANAKTVDSGSTCNLETQCKNKNFHECDFSGCADETSLNLRKSSLSGTLPTQLGTMVNLENLYVRMKYLEAWTPTS